MELILNILLLILGFVLLIKGANMFVSGASALAQKLGVPEIVVGLTIVAIGTSLPEFSVSVVSAINHNNDMSVANIIGSNIFNILIVLGGSALIKKVGVERKMLFFEFSFLLMVTILLLIVTIVQGSLNWYIGIIYLLSIVVFIIILIKRNKDSTKVCSEIKIFKIILLLLFGGGLIILGGELVNRTSVEIANFFKMDEKLIGLTICAIGTSLPELVTSIVASKKGSNEIAIGNVIGSNILNITFILGFCSVITSLPISFALIVDIVICLITTIIVYIFSLKKEITRANGIILIIIYLLYFTYIIIRNYCI